MYGEPDFKTTFLGTDWLDNDTDGDGVVDGLDDQDYDDFLNVEELSRGTSRAARRTRTRARARASGSSRTTRASRRRTRGPARRASSWTSLRGAPFKDPDATDPVPRWPLYGRLLGNGTTDDISDVVYNPKDIDQAAYEAAHALDSTVTPDSFPDITSPEVWAARRSALTQSLPPLHPLPR